MQQSGNHLPEDLQRDVNLCTEEEEEIAREIKGIRNEQQVSLRVEKRVTPVTIFSNFFCDLLCIQRVLKRQQGGGMDQDGGRAGPSTIAREEDLNEDQVNIFFC